MNWPGIPSQGIAEAKIFWLSFWASFYSGILYSVVTGLIVGIVVWQLETQSENRAELRQAQKDISVLRQHLRQTLSKSRIISIESAEQAIPSLIHEVINNLDSLPLDRWRSRLRGRERGLKGLMALTYLYRDFMIAASNFDAVLRVEVRKYHASQNLDLVNDQELCSYIIGQVAEQPHEEVLPWLVVKSQRIEEEAKQLLARERVAITSQLYQQARKKLLNQFIRVEETLWNDKRRSKHLSGWLTRR
ncbi:MAG: hypothetical protein JO235_17950 [Chroococcidiopsidaceae cyanobacterium CP_BM_RX_35]|nr:hypothetical protein [Chroococcidiopsidaceae cyanobacterium CP_BM_RX_35]